MQQYFYSLLRNKRYKQLFAPIFVVISKL